MQYGFTKIRKGPDVDMYCNPGFIRGDEDGLAQLRKRTKTPARKNQVSYTPFSSPVNQSSSYSIDFQPSFRVISPSTLTCGSSDSCDHSQASSVGSDHTYGGPSNSSRRNSERLSLLADAMLMMIGGD